MWIIKASVCYLGDEDKLVDEPKDAHKFKYKHEAKDHATTWCLFNQWISGDPINVKLIKIPK